MGSRIYWKRVHKRAWAEAAQLLGLDSWVQFMLRIIGAIAAIAGLALWGSEGASQDELIMRGIGIGAILAVFPLVYICKFAAIPPKIDYDKRENIKNLTKELEIIKAQLEQKKVRRHSVLTLSTLIEKGYNFSAEKISNETYNNWDARKTLWEHVVGWVLSNNFSHYEFVSFKTIHYQTMEDFDSAINKNHNKELQVLMIRINILKEIIQKHQKDWPPMGVSDKVQIEEELKIIESQVIASQRH